MKVGYRTASGHQLTAYLDVDDTEGLTVVTGTEKHTDEPVTLRWDDVAGEWVEAG